jgi:tetratricopeptide (TPR) repeat protein
MGSSYDIDMKYYADGDDRAVWWRVIDNHGGGILKSGVDKVEANGRDDAIVRDELVSILAKRFASTRGVINALETRDGAAANLLGNSCVLKAEYELDEGGRAGIRSALPCLEQTVAIQPGNADALAVLSRTLVASEGGNPATTPFDRALTMANRAASLDPTSDRAQVALMMAQFYRGSTKAAIAAGNDAMALNPDNPDVLSKLAGVLYSAGYPEAAISLAEESAKDVDAVPRDARIVLALDAYLRGDYSKASLVSEQINCGDVVVRAIRAASLGQMAAADATSSLDYLKAMLPDYQTGLRQRVEWRRYPASVIASLEQGLAKARQVSAEPRRAPS